MTSESSLGPSLITWLNATGHMFMELDRNFNVIVADPNLTKRFRVQPGSICYRGLAGQDRICPDCPVQRVYNGSPGAEDRREVRDAQGRAVDIHVSIAPKLNQSGNVVGSWVMATEISKADSSGVFQNDANRHFRELLENLPDVVFCLDPVGRFIFANRRTEELLGYGVRQLLGKSLWDLLPSDELTAARTILDTPLGSCWDSELSVTDATGQQRHVRVRCVPLWDSESDSVWFEGVMRDRTAQRALEMELTAYRERLRESKHRYRRLVQQVPDVIFSLDSQGRFTFVNAQVENLLGYPVEKMLGTALKDHISEEFRHIAESILDVEAESVWDEELSIVDVNGVRKWVRIRYRPVFDAQGRLWEYEGVMRDRTSRKKLEEDLRSSKEELLEKIKVIDELYEHIVQSEKSKAIAEHTAEVAHEIRQPLAIIGGFARRMYKQLEGCKKLNPDSQRECFAVIIGEVQRLERILGGLIDFTRQKTVQKRSIDPNSLIEEILHVYEERFREKDIKLEVDFGEEIGAVMLDPDRFFQVVRNLVSNAIDASRRHGMIRVTTGVFVASAKARETGDLETEAYFELRVRNGGKIIPPEELRRIFDPFYTTKDSGTGLGLALVKRIVEEHDGSISVKSDEMGTIFTVWIPLRTAEWVYKNALFNSCGPAGHNHAVEEEPSSPQS